MKQARLAATLQRNDDTIQQQQQRQVGKQKQPELKMNLDGWLRLSDEIQASAQLELQIQ